MPALHISVLLTNLWQQQSGALIAAGASFDTVKAF